MSEFKCEACNKSVEIAAKNKLTCYNAIYILCANCLFSLITYNLSPKQYFNLIWNYHVVDEFYLHCDFYNVDGESLQPKI